MSIDAFLLVMFELEQFNKVYLDQKTTHVADTSL